MVEKKEDHFEEEDIPEPFSDVPPPEKGKLPEVTPVSEKDTSEQLTIEETNIQEQLEPTEPTETPEELLKKKKKKRNIILIVVFAVLLPLLILGGLGLFAFFALIGAFESCTVNCCQNCSDTCVNSCSDSCCQGCSDSCSSACNCSNCDCGNSCSGCDCNCGSSIQTSERNTSWLNLLKWSFYSIFGLFLKQ